MRRHTDGQHHYRPLIGIRGAWVVRCPKTGRRYHLRTLRDGSLHCPGCEHTLFLCPIVGGCGTLPTMPTQDNNLKLNEPEDHLDGDPGDEHKPSSAAPGNVGLEVLEHVNALYAHTKLPSGPATDTTYNLVIADHPRKFAAPAVGFKRGAGDEKMSCQNCFHWYTSPGAGRAVCEIMRPADSDDVKGQDRCLWWTEDGLSFPLRQPKRSSGPSKTPPQKKENSRPTSPEPSE